MEFRGFVTNKKLNAISQYYSFIYFPDLELRKQSLEAKMIKFFENNIWDKIPLDSYVIDFVVIEDQVKVLEFNPFNESTGGCLCSWETDDKIMRQGPFEFRYLQEPVIQKIKGEINREWQELIFN